MKLLSVIVFYVLTLPFGICQNSLYRIFTPSVVPNFFSTGNTEAPVLTVDSGYLLTTRLFLMGFETPGSQGPKTIIKTDSAFIPQWQKQSYGSCVLPTGGIIVFGDLKIEKVTNSGVSVWTRTVAQNVVLTDAVTYSNVIRLVGNVRSTQYIGTTAYFTNDGLTLLLDTNGNYSSHQLFQSSLFNLAPLSNQPYRASANFSRIERAASGDFYVYSNSLVPNGVGSNMAISKFSSTFTFLWAKYCNTAGNHIIINDIDELANGRLVATGLSRGYGTNSNLYPALFKLSSAGDLQQQFFFPGKTEISGLCKKPSGNYVISQIRNDSIYQCEIDTSLNVLWYNFRVKGNTPAGSVVKGSRYFSLFYRNYNTVLLSSTLGGQSCTSYSAPFSALASSLTLDNFTLSPVAYTLNLVSTAASPNYTVGYQDTCFCSANAPVSTPNVCLGTSVTVTTNGNGNLSWYSAATGGSFIQPGNQFVFSSATPTTLTLFVQDSVCTAFPLRTPVTVNFYAPPSINFSVVNPTICAGNYLLISVSGALSYSWSGLGTQSIYYISPSATTIYTVTGFINPTCFDTKTLSFIVYPLPTLSVVGPTAICLGTTANFSVSGANNYLWSNTTQGPFYNVTPSFAGVQNFAVSGSFSNTGCATSMQKTLTVLSIPQTTITANSNSVCSGSTLQLNANGALSYSWNTGAASSAILISPLSSTVYSVVGYNGICSSNSSFSVYVNSLPQFSIIGPSTICAGSPATFSATAPLNYTWSNSVYGNQATFTSVTYNNSIWAAGSDGTCVAKVTSSIQVQPLVTPYWQSSSLLPCEGQSHTLTAQGANSYTWNNTVSSQSIVIVPNSTTIYTLMGAVNSCTGLKVDSIIVYPNPSVNSVSGFSNVCKGTQVVFTATSSSGASLFWLPGNFYQTVNFTATASAVYTVLAISPQQCTAVAFSSVQVNPGPVLFVTSSPSAICAGGSSTLLVTGAQKYFWNTQDTLSGKIVQLQSSAVYSVTGTDSMGCQSTTAVSILVDACTSLKSDRLEGFKWNVVPNPSNGKVYLFGTFTEGMHLELLSSVGAVLFERDIDEIPLELDFQNYPNGVYLLREKGSGSVTRLILQK